MHPQRQRKAIPVFWVNSVDRLGRRIDPAVLSVAQEIGPSAVRYAEKVLGDPALAITLFEEAAATVSQTQRERTSRGTPDVKDMRGYLFLAYIRRVRREKRAEPVLNDPKSLDLARPAQYMETQAVERNLIMAEALATCDTVSQNIVLRRLEGFSWKEIELLCDVSAHAARQRFSATLHRLRSIFQRRGRVP